MPETQQATPDDTGTPVTGGWALRAPGLRAPALRGPALEGAVRAGAGGRLAPLAVAPLVLALGPALALGLAVTLATVSPSPLAAQIGDPVEAVSSADSTADSIADSIADSAVSDAASAGPRPVAPADYGRWEMLGTGTLAPTGEWLAVPIRRVNEEDELRIRRVGTDSVVVIEYGAQPRFSEDGRWLAYSIGLSEEAREKLEKQKRRPESQLGILDLAEGDTTLVPGVASFAFSDDGRWLAMRRYAPPGSRGGGSGGSGGPGGGGDDAHGADLVVRDLRTGTDANFGNVGSYAWQEGGVLLAMTVDAADNAGNGVRVWNPERGTLRVLDSSTDDYTELAWREDSDDLLALRVTKDEERERPTHAVLLWKGVAGSPRAFAFDPTARPGFPADTRVVEHRPPSLSDDGRAIFFGVAEWPLTEEAEAKRAAAERAAADSAVADSTAGAGPEGGEDGPGAGQGEGQGQGNGAGADAEEKAGVEVWHSRDVDIIPRQKVTAEADRRTNRLAVWWIEEDRLVMLGDERLEEVRRIEGDRWALGTDETPHDLDRMFGPAYEDIYLIDTRTGEARPVIERVQYFFGASPAGRYLLYLRDDHYHVYDIRRDRHVNLTAGIPAVFVDTADDHTVAQKPPFYVAGWTEGDGRVLLNDEYDVWSVRPDGSGGRRLTAGREDSTVHRYNRVGWAEDQEAIDPGAPAYYNLTGQWSKKNGYAVADRLDRRPERRIWLDAGVGRLARADDADVFAYVVEDFHDSPDYFIARGRLAGGTQLTRTNPFQDEFLWGRPELVEFRNEAGERLQGALFYPAGYEPGTRYPMITYIYEIRSPSVHSYSVPTERSAYNTAVWTAQGYFVFQPDITYRPRNPGLSAVEALVPAVDAVVATGMVDPARVGLVGHSWGGYQTAFVPTRTDRFAAAVAGAPLTDLVSMYLSIYWNSGGTDARIFEISQGRMEVPPWEDMAAYTANSPVHNIERLNTPMLVAFGDEDGAVDWDQGIVFYNAARRAGKQMVLLVYEGENHGLRKKPNQIDYHRRINEWFAHYLKGAPAPAWLEAGVPYLRQQDGDAEPASQPPEPTAVADPDPPAGTGSEPPAGDPPGRR